MNTMKLPYSTNPSNHHLIDAEGNVVGYSPLTSEQTLWLMNGYAHTIALWCRGHENGDYRVPQDQIIESVRALAGLAEWLPLSKKAALNS